MNFRRTAALAAKEWREIVRDKLFLALSFIVPTILLVLFGYGLVLDVENVPFTIVDYDGSAFSRDYGYRLIHSRYFDFKGYLESEHDLPDLLGDGRVRLALIIPEHFQERLLAGRPATVQTLIDGTFPYRAQTLKGYVAAIDAGINQSLIAEHLMATRGISREQAETLAAPIRLEIRYLYNQRLESLWNIGPAQIMFVLMFTAPLLTALGVVREKETGSIYNIYASTVTGVEYLVGKLAPQLLISGLNLLILWLIICVGFGVPFRGDPLLFIAASVLFLLCTIGIGLVISLIVASQVAALFITVIVAMVPTILYSGMLIPVSTLKPSAQFQAHLFPGMYFNNVIQGSFLKGVGLTVLWPDLLALALYAALLMIAGYALFGKRPRR